MIKKCFISFLLQAKLSVNLFADYGYGDDVRQGIRHGGRSAIYIHGNSVEIPIEGDGLPVAAQYDSAA
jgi:hypothetical protein